MSGWNGNGVILSSTTWMPTRARQRLRDLTGGQRSVPVLIEDDKVIRVGWQGRTCMIDAE